MSDDKDKVEPATGESESEESVESSGVEEGGDSSSGEEKGDESGGEEKGDESGGEESGAAAEGEGDDSPGTNILAGLVLFVIIAGVVGLFVGYALVRSNADIPFLSTGTARMKSGVVVLVAGTIAERLAAEKSQSYSIALTSKPDFWPSSEISGEATTTSVKSSMELTMGKAVYKAKRPAPNTPLEGAVKKSRWDWKVKQSKKKNKIYKIDRFGFGKEPKLNLQIKDGKIKGKWSYLGKKDVLIPQVWEISGSYDEKTNKVQVDIDVENSMFDLTLAGMVAPSDK